ncbi:hypothetical protein BC938DRAFT_481898 [Jimgerdemannia flammicorona]|uniref:OPT oligopeptide transporter protein-domain-containing protein n=1 Tax=Jimgerdemannia flammicorona TaxID=994334 RepID=A0A433QF98_9FUNG|nr:hypothetical protein BC938DRAFT_481898 [Jimgerdemannia flammicorona]
MSIRVEEKAGLGNHQPNLASEKPHDNIDNDVVFTEKIDKDEEAAQDEIEIEENSPIPMVAAVVSNKDDPTLPIITFRFWVLSTLFTIMGASLSQFYFFRQNGPGYSILFVQLASWSLGKLMARWLPERQFNLFGWRFSFNPGPFNVKEHVIIAPLWLIVFYDISTWNTSSVESLSDIYSLAASTGGTSAYATDILTIQDLFYGQRIGPLGGIMLLITSQSLGYALAGICQKYLVRPAAMVSIPAPLNPLDSHLLSTHLFASLPQIWPSNLVSVSLYNTLHGNESATRKQFRYFLIAFGAMFVWQFFPTFIAPILSSLAVLCWIGPNNPTLNKLGAAANGLGMLDFSLDWNAISTFGPMYTPFWAQMNYFAGIIFQVWILIPILYFNNVWNAKTFPIASTKSFDKFGHTYNQTRIINPQTGALDQDIYDKYSPVSLSISFATAYFFSLAAYASTITHVGLFYGREIWNRFMASRSEENDDIHTKLMRIYPEVPNWWYGRSSA